jgi:hypothetical protein
MAFTAAARRKILLLVLAMGGPSAHVQASNPTWHFGQNGERSVRMTGAVQFWLRHTELNPGSEVSGVSTTSALDVSIRRLRLGAWIEPFEKTHIRLNLGFNNLNRLTSGNVDLHLLDGYIEYRLSAALELGAGKSAWNGLSRFATPNPMALLAYDLPIVGLPTINVTDDLLRNLGVFAKGQIGRIDYRWTVYQPYSVEDGNSFSPELEEGIATFRDEDEGNTTGTSGYLKWQFFEHESNASAFSPGTHLGKKKVMALGVGYEFDSNRTAHLEEGSRVINDLNLWAVDYFLDLPLSEDENAFTLYAAYLDYDYGPNLIRNVGVNNIATASDSEPLSFNGAGNAFPQLGSGDTVLLQVGYLTRYRSFGRLQPYFWMQYSNWERLDDPMISWNLGTHWLLNGHRSKVSFNLESRPIFFEDNEGIKAEDRKVMFVIQYQFQI